MGYSRRIVILTNLSVERQQRIKLFRSWAKVFQKVSRFLMVESHLAWPEVAVKQKKLKRRYFGCVLGHPSQTPAEKKYVYCAINKVSMRPIVISRWNLIKLDPELLFNGQIKKKVYRLCFGTFIPNTDCKKNCGMYFFHPLRAKQSWRAPRSLGPSWTSLFTQTDFYLLCSRRGGAKQQVENRLWSRALWEFLNCNPEQRIY